MALDIALRDNGAVGGDISLAAGGGAFELDLEPLSYSLSLFDATLVAGRALNAEPFSYAVTLFDATLTRGFNFSADPLAYAVTLFDASMFAAPQLPLHPPGVNLP